MWVLFTCRQEQLKWMSTPRMSLGPAVCVCGHCKLIQPLRTAWDAAEAAGGNVEMLIVVGKHQEN